MMSGSPDCQRGRDNCFRVLGKNALLVNFYVKLVSHKIEYDQSAWRLYEKVSSFDFFFDPDSMFNGY